MPNRCATFSCVHLERGVVLPERRFPQSVSHLSQSYIHNRGRALSCCPKDFMRLRIAALVDNLPNGNDESSLSSNFVSERSDSCSKLH
jgi:hypothetical protein